MLRNCRRFAVVCLSLVLVFCVVADDKKEIDCAIWALIEAIVKEGNLSEGSVWNTVTCSETLKAHLSTRHQAMDSTHPKFLTGGGLFGHQFFDDSIFDDSNENNSDVSQRIVKAQAIDIIKDRGGLENLLDVEYIPHDSGEKNAPSFTFDNGKCVKRKRNGSMDLSHFLGKKPECKVTIGLEKNRIYRPYIMYPAEETKQVGNKSIELRDARDTIVAKNGGYWAKVEQDGLVFGLKKVKKSGDRSWVVCTIYPTSWSQPDSSSWKKATYDTNKNQVDVEW